MSEKQQAPVRTSAEGANDFLASLADAPDTIGEDDFAAINESLMGPPEPEETPREVIEFEKQYGVESDDGQQEEDPLDEGEIDYVAEYNKLKTKIGKQAAKQGEIRARAEKAEAELARLRGEQQPVEPQPAVTGKSFVTELAKQRGVEIPEDLQDIYSVVGDLFLAYTQNLGAHLRPIGEEIRSIKGSLAETAAEASLGGLSPEVKAQLLEENPGLAEISDPAQRIAMMKKLALAEGLARDDAPGKRTVADSRRSPARHVSSSGSSGPTKSRGTNLNEAIGRAIDGIESEDDLKKLSGPMSHYFKNVW